MMRHRAWYEPARSARVARMRMACSASHRAVRACARGPPNLNVPLCLTITRASKLFPFGVLSTPHLFGNFSRRAKFSQMDW